MTVHDKYAYAPHTLEVGDYGGAAPGIPHFRCNAKRCAPPRIKRDLNRHPAF